MKTQVSTVKKSDPSSNENQLMSEIVDSFFSDSCVDAVTCLESMLFEWYQNYAPEHYDNDHIDEVVNTTFRVNDLLLKLQDVILRFGEGDAQGAVDRKRIIRTAY